MNVTATTDTRRVHGFCGLCIARCGAIATVENGLNCPDFIGGGLV